MHSLTKTFATTALLYLSHLISLGADATAVLTQVVEPYTDAARKAAGREPLKYGSKSVTKKGEIPDMLDCTTFASPVLHRFFGGEWVKFNTTIQQGWPDQVAVAYKLTGAETSKVKEHLENFKAKKLTPGVYFFDLRTGPALLEDISKRDPASGAQGHCGFLIVEGTGGSQLVTQIHMSGSKSATGNADGGLAYNKLWSEFLNGTAYGKTANAGLTSQLTLFPLKAP